MFITSPKCLYIYILRFFCSFRADRVNRAFEKRELHARLGAGLREIAHYFDRSPPLFAVLIVISNFFDFLHFQAQIHIL